MNSGFTALRLVLAFTLGALLEARAGSATWHLNPTSGDWNTAANWMPATVPNGTNEVATFSASNLTNVSLSQAVEVDSLVFDASAPSFTITTPGLSFFPLTTLVFDGAGVTNNSGKAQYFVAAASLNGASQMIFSGSASAGAAVTYETQGGQGVEYGATINFQDFSEAGSATFDVDGAPSFYASTLYFFDSSSAKKATLNILSDKSIYGGQVTFGGNATADHALVNLLPSAHQSYGLVYFYLYSTAGYANFDIQTGQITFDNNSSADHATFTYRPNSLGAIRFHNHATASHAQFILYGATENTFGQVTFKGSSHADRAVLTLNGASAPGPAGSEVFFQENSHADFATLAVNGGSDGGAGSLVDFSGNANGGEAVLQVFGNGNLNISNHATPVVSIGSLGGDGTVSLGANNLSVGSNNHNTTFSGVIDDAGQGGSITKEGLGRLQLAGANTYAGGTIVNSGTLAVINQTGSATGTGAVEVNTGSLAGSGMIAGAVTIGSGSGSGASLAPGQLIRQTTLLRIGGMLSFQNDGSYNCNLSTQKVTADEVAASGVTIASGAQFHLQTSGNRTLLIGTVFILISNSSGQAIAGTFANLPDDGILQSGLNRFQANYEGGDGNDLTLTVVP